MAAQCQPNRVKLFVGGRSFTITTDRPKEEMQVLADMVNAKIKEAGLPSNMGSLNELVVAALLLAKDVRDAEEKQRNVRRTLRSQSRQMLSNLDVERIADEGAPPDPIDASFEIADGLEFGLD